MSEMDPKAVVRVVTLREQKEGGGFTIRRSIGSSSFVEKETDPFLMLDELPRKTFKPAEFPGAPWHPHRGMDTVMYMKRGEGSHEDSMGNKGTLRDGDCQWMTAASGIEHNEATGHPGGEMHGFQCWINLPKAHKMDPPAYADIRAASIPTATVAPGVVAKVIAGEVGELKAVVQPIVPVQCIDFMCEAGGKFSHQLPAGMSTCVVHVYEGEGDVKGELSISDMLLIGKGDALVFEAGAKGGSFLCLAGAPINEPIVWHGPFVMNTQAEIRQCFADLQAGTFIKHKGTYRQL
ncbi:pirin protein [Pavlovales sp. CCMP2436]|nr:pirin protein [Pavlovales sp. CCMP2436]